MSATSRRTCRPDECLLDNATLLPACRKPSLTPVTYPDTAISSGGGHMEYQGFIVDAFERDPGKWRAKLSRASGRPLITGRKRIWQFVTGIDATTSPAALLMALEAIDAGTFSSATPLPENFWRRRGQRSNAPTFDDRSISCSAARKSKTKSYRRKQKSPGDQDGAKSELVCWTICKSRRSVPIWLPTYPKIGKLPNWPNWPDCPVDLPPCRADR